MSGSDSVTDSVNREHYCSRANAYTRMTGGVGDLALVDKRNPQETVKLEPWLATVFLLADGQHTVNDLILHLRGQYGGNVPVELERTILSVVGRLVESGTVQLSDLPHDLPYHLARPVEELDPEEAKRYLQEDGYCQPLR